MTQPLRICLIGSAQSIHIKRWAKFLASRNHEVHVLSVFHDRIDGATIWKLPSKARYGNFSYVLSLPKVYQLLRQLNPDVVHVHYLGGSSIYFPVLRGRVTVATPWGSDIYTLQSSVWSFMVRKLLEKSDKVITTSKSMAETIMKLFRIESEKIATYSWGIDLDLFKPATEAKRTLLRRELNIPLDTFVIFSNRTMAPIYRTDVILESFLNIKEKRHALFLVVLEGPIASNAISEYRTRLRKRAANDNSIRFLSGVITPETMAKYLQVSDVAISIPTSDQRGSSVLEAFASGPIVILSNLPVYKEMCKEGYKAIMLQDASKEELAKAILETCSMDFSLQETARNNHDIVKQRENWNVQAAKVEDEYYALLKASRKAD